MQFQKEIDQYLISKSSRLKEKNNLRPSQGANLFSPTTITISAKDFELVAAAIKGFFSARNALARQNNGFKPPNYSVLMSYDFHMTEDGPKLIEINTNAGQSLYANALYEFKKESMNYLPKLFLDSLRDSFLNEAQLMGLGSRISSAITDDQPEGQFFYPEFLLMADQMDSWGWEVRTCGAEVLKWKSNKKNGLMCGNEQIEFIYNRLTDFYLSEHEDLQQAYLSGEVCFSPNPYEYELLANKQRLVEFSDKINLAKLVTDINLRSACEKVLPKTYDIQKMDLEEVWKNKKKYFFKPKTSFAGKGAYRGESIQRKIVDEISKKDYLVQEFIRAPEIEISVDGTTLPFKYDLRFYVYKDQIQLVSARIYQGQVTNFRERGAGITTVQIA